MTVLRYHPGTLRDAEEAEEWYAEILYGLDEDSFRVAMLEDFPYGIHYHDFEDHVLIVAIHHGARSSKIRTKRI